MIKPQDKMFANLVIQLHHDLPLAPLTRVVNLATIALGILRSKSLQVGQIITALPLAGTRDSLKKRVQRFLKNAGVTVDTYYQPLAQRILRRLVAGGARGHLTLDRMEWRGVNLLYVCVGWRGRALPLVRTSLMSCSASIPTPPSRSICSRPACGSNPSQLILSARISIASVNNADQ